MTMRDQEHKTTVRMPLSLHKAARIKAIEEDTTLSDVVRAFVRRWVAGELELPSLEDEATEQEEAAHP